MFTQQIYVFYLKNWKRFYCQNFVDVRYGWSEKNSQRAI